MEEVLREFQKQFIDDVEADVVASDLRFHDIIPQGCHEQISRTVVRIQRNEILHDRMVTNCSREAVIVACNIFTVKEGYPRIKALGVALKKSLEIGLHVCVRVYACAFMCVHVCTVIIRTAKCIWYCEMCRLIGE